MIKTKLKICAGCNKPKYIWKSSGKEKYCHQCWLLKEPSKKIRPISKKRQEKLDEYSKKRLALLALFPTCQIGLPGCLGVVTDIHHLYSGKNRDKYFLVISTWKTSCRSCHQYIHDKLSSEEAIELGFKLTE